MVKLFFQPYLVIAAGLADKFENATKLQKYFKVYLIGFVLTLMALAYAANISLKAYTEIILKVGFGSGFWSGFLMTVGIACAVYFLLGAFAGGILDLFSPKKRVDWLYFGLSAFLLGAILTLDINANFVGTQQIGRASAGSISEAMNIRVDQTTGAVMSTTSEQEATASYDQTIRELKEEKASIKNCDVKGYCYRGYVTKDGKARLAQIDTELTKAEDRKQAALDRTHKIGDQNGELILKAMDKTEGIHKNLVIYIYPVCFLLCLFSKSYEEEALDHLRGASDHEEVNTPIFTLEDVQKMVGPNGTIEHMNGSKVHVPKASGSGTGSAIGYSTEGKPFYGLKRTGSDNMPPSQKGRITAAQKRVKRYYDQYKKKEGKAPSMNHISKATGVHRSTVKNAFRNFNL